MKNLAVSDCAIPFQVFVCEDFNSKLELGRTTPEDEEAGLSCCLGAHAMAYATAMNTDPISPTPWTVCKEHSV